MLQSFHGPGIPDQNLWGLLSGHSTSLLQGLQLCVADRLSWTDLQALTAQLLLILTLHFAKGKKEPKLLKLDQKSNTHWDEMCRLMNSHNKPKIYICKVQQTYIKGEFIIYYNNYKLLFSEHSRWSTTCISAVTKKGIKITNVMPYFCAVEKAVFKRVELLANIQGDSPYTFCPRNVVI